MRRCYSQINGLCVSDESNFRVQYVSCVWPMYVGPANQSDRSDWQNKVHAYHVHVLNLNRTKNRKDERQFSGTFQSFWQITRTEYCNDFAERQMEMFFCGNRHIFSFVISQENVYLNVEQAISLPFIWLTAVCQISDLGTFKISAVLARCNILPILIRSFRNSSNARLQLVGFNKNILTRSDKKANIKAKRTRGARNKVLFKNELI